jgi:hypothetical protein
MNPQAESLNEIIRKESPVVYDLLSRRGREVFFPKKGILSQGAAARGKKIDATIGSAIEDDGSAMRLRSIANSINIPPDKVFPYAPSSGRPDIRKKWKEMILEKNPLLKGGSFSNPVVTLALTHGLSMLGYLFVDEERLLFFPTFTGKITPLSLRTPMAPDFRISAFSAGRALILTLSGAPSAMARRV